MTSYCAIRFRNSRIPNLTHTYLLQINFSRLAPKAIYYRNYKNFDESKFNLNLANTDFSLQSNDPEEIKIAEKYAYLKNKFITDKLAPL